MKSRKLVSLMIVAVMIAAALVPLRAAAVDETPKISLAPMNLIWPENSLAWYRCACSNDPGHEKFNYEWFIVYDGKKYPVGVNGSDSDPWWKYVDKSSPSTGTIGNVISLDKINHGLNGAEIYCVVSSNSASVESPHATIRIGDDYIFTPPEITLAPVYVVCEEGDEVELKVDANCTSGNVTEIKDFITYTWYHTDTGEIDDIMAVFQNGSDVTGKTFKPDTSTAGTYYYVCGVFDGADNPSMGNYSYTNVITLEVLEKTEYLEMEILSNPKKYMYYVGDDVDLKGLSVRILTSNGYMNLYDGDGVSVSPKTVTKEGVQSVTISYEGLEASFKINAVEKPVPIPTITKQPEGGVFTVGDKCVLSVEAKAENGCKLAYQWYQAQESFDYEGAKELSFEMESTFSPKQVPGVRHYYCAVYAMNESTKKLSDPVTTYIVSVEYKEAETVTETETGTESSEEVTDDGTETSGDVSDASEQSGTAEPGGKDSTAAPGTAEPGTAKAPSSGRSSKALVIVLTAVASALLLTVAAVTVMLSVISAKKKKAAKDKAQQ